MNERKNELVLGITKKDSDVVIINTTNFNFNREVLTDKMATLLYLQTGSFWQCFASFEDPRVVEITIQHL